MPDDEESALVVLVPEAEPIVAQIRSRFDRSAIRGMPAHITILYPFVHPDQLSVDLASMLGSLVARSRCFRFALAGVCGFPGVLYLVPDPLEPFDALTREMVREHPGLQPYGGLVANPVPHLTIAQRPPAGSLSELSRAFIDAWGEAFPVECRARDVALAVKQSGRWSIRDRLPLS